MGVYVIDSNFLIQAHRVSYPLDIAVSFWNKVKLLAAAGKIISIDKVKREIFGKNDALEAWCIENLPNDFFKDTTSVMQSYNTVVTWALDTPRYSQAALNEFLSADEADAFIVAFALDNLGNRVVVTQEKSRPEMKRKVKIPEACDAVGIRYVDTIEMLRELGETF